MAKFPVKASFQDQFVVTQDNDVARELYQKYRFGVVKNKRVCLDKLEALYLFEENKIEIYNGRNQKQDYAQVHKRLSRGDKQFATKYAVYRDLRKRGYIIKTALKFGAEFRVYPKGVKPGEDHAKWVVYPVPEHQSMTWYEFSAKNRVAHSTKKNLLVGVVDAEQDVTYYEIQWKRP